MENENFQAKFIKLTLQNQQKRRPGDIFENINISQT